MDLIIEYDGKLNVFFFLPQVWAIEAIPKLGDTIAKRVYLDRLPRCLRYDSTSTMTSKSLRLKDILEDPEVYFKLQFNIRLELRDQ